MSDDLLRNFAKLGEKAFEKLSSIIFADFKTQFRQNFMDLKMVINMHKNNSKNFKDNVLQRIFNYLNEITPLIHKTYTRKVWKLCLEKVTLLYIQSLLFLAKDVKFKKIEHLREKLATDIEHIHYYFKNVVDSSTRETNLKAIQDLQEFVEANPPLISMTVVTLKKVHGEGFNYSTLKLLMNLRVDIKSSEKSSILEDCKQVLAKIVEPPEQEEKPPKGELYLQIKQEYEEELKRDRMKLQGSFSSFIMPT